MIKGYGHAGGKVILVGEHSVVYNKAAIALPFDKVGVSCTVEDYPKGIYIEMDIYQGMLETIPSNLSGIKILIDEVVKRLNIRDGLKIILDIKMPPSRGLGYSASVSCAIIKALYDAHNVKLDQELLINLVHLAERVNHSNPSGLDGFTIASDKPVYFSNGIKSFFEPKFSGIIVVADTGIKGNTKEAVKAVSMVAPNVLKMTLDHLDAIAIKSKEALEFDDINLMGQLMNQAQDNLSVLGVSNDYLDLLIDVSCKHGAVGAKLTGGGKGGCMIALCKQEEDAKVVSEALLEKGATQTWMFSIGGSYE